MNLEHGGYPLGAERDSSAPYNYLDYHEFPVRIVGTFEFTIPYATDNFDVIDGMPSPDYDTREILRQAKQAIENGLVDFSKYGDSNTVILELNFDINEQ